MRKTIIGLALLALGTGGGALAQTSGWQVSEVSGDVRTVVNGQTRPVTRGMLLASGSTIASSARARAVLVSGRDYVILSPASRVRLPGGTQLTSGGGWVGNMTQIVSEAGTALYRIERRPNPHFRVQTPYLAAVVKGTVFSVTVSSSGASVQVTEGAVEVSTVDGGAAELVRPGMVATVGAGDLMELNIQGEVSRTIRSNGVPLPGVATVPVADAGRYEGPADSPVEVTAAVREEPVPLADATDGLVTGLAGVDLALADIRDERRPPVGTPTGGGNDNSGPGNNNGGGNGDPGAGGDNGNGDPGNNGGGNGDPGGNGGGNGGGGDNGTGNPGGGNGGGNGDPGGNNGGGNGDPGGNGGGNGDPGGNNGGGNGDPGGNNGGGNGDPGGNNGGGNGDPGGNNGGGNGDPGGNNGGGNGDPGGNNGGGNGDPGGNNGGGNGDPGGNNGGANGDPGADDGNNGGGNDEGGTDPGNPGNGGGNDNGDPGNNGGGNGGDGDDDGNSGNGGGNGGGNGNGGGLNVCLPADLACIGIGGANNPRSFYALTVLFDDVGYTGRTRR